jgi:hypothetical protein
MAQAQRRSRVWWGLALCAEFGDVIAAERAVGGSVLVSVGPARDRTLGICSMNWPTILARGRRVSLGLKTLYRDIEWLLTITSAVSGPISSMRRCSPTES